MQRARLVIAALLIGAEAVFAGPFEDGVEAYGRKDYVTAVRLLRQSADAGSAAAQFNLGRMYAFGQGVPQDELQAVFWFRKAAEQGDVDAQVSLAGVYAFGSDRTQDLGQATFWFRKAAEQGDAVAQFQLGRMYSLGRGVPKDDVQAYFWLLLASVEGSADAINARDQVASRITTKQRTGVESEVRNWKPR